MDRLCAVARIYVYIFLDRIANERERCGLSGLPPPFELAVVIPFRVYDLDLGIGARHLHFVISLVHVGREIGK